MSAENSGELLVKEATAAGDYRIDDQDVRPWGHYIVTAVGRTPEGEEYCEKQIVIKPWHVLSLQSHALRREEWTVGKGFLTALVDGECRNAGPDETVHVPQGSIHCMANLTDEICIVHERQEGICREDDIRRFVDAYGRGTDAASPESAAAIAAYNKILHDIREKRAARADRVTQ
jgi:mannose-6-phosphate isomerase-like protein (cupin superfamily)